MFGLFRSHKHRLDVFAGATMGTSYTVKVVGRAGRLRRDRTLELQQKIDEELRRVCELMSSFLSRSELSRFNAHADGWPFHLSDETFHVVERALQVSAESGGAFDITVGPIVNLYGFGPEPFRVNLPSDEEIAAIMPRVGYRMLELDPIGKTIRKDRPDVHCDLSGIAKGYAVDRAAAVLDACGNENYMVEIGGEIRIRGRNAEGEPWRIAIERPIAEGRAVHRVVSLADRSIATTGDYRVCYIKDGKRVSHTIDPRTGRPVEHRLASVTVIQQDCESADAWATALMVLGPEAGHALAEQKNLPALFLVRGRDETIVENVTSAFLALA